MSSSVFLDFAEGILMWLPAALTNVIALNVELFLGQLGSWWHQARTSLARMPMMPPMREAGGLFVKCRMESLPIWLLWCRTPHFFKLLLTPGTLGYSLSAILNIPNANSWADLFLQDLGRGAEYSRAGQGDHVTFICRGRPHSWCRRTMSRLARRE